MRKEQPLGAPAHECEHVAGKEDFCEHYDEPLGFEACDFLPHAPVEQAEICERHEAGAQCEACVAVAPPDEERVQPVVQCDGEKADHHRRLAATDGVEGGREHFHPGVGGEAGCVEAEGGGALLDVVSADFAVFIDHAEDRIGEHPQTDACGQGEEKDEADSACERAAKINAIAERCAARKEGQDDRADCDAEHSERKLHEAEGVVQPRDGACFAVRGEAGVHHHIHLHGARGDDGGGHVAKHVGDAGVAPVEIKTRMVADAPQRRELDGELKKTADERAIREAEERVTAKAVVHPPRERKTADDAADVEKRRRHRGPAEDVFCVQHPHHLRSERDHEDEREHHSREFRSKRRVLAGESACDKADELFGKNHSQHRDDAHYDESERADAIRQFPRGGLSLGGDFF